MTGRKPWLIGVLALTAVWAVVWVVVNIAGGFDETPEKIADFIESDPIGAMDGTGREKMVREVARRINQLDYDERREFRERRGDGGLRRPEFFDSLTDPEKILFIELTMDTTFKRMMESFNNMEPDERGKLVDRALRDLERDGDWDRDRGREELDDLDPDLYNKMVTSGLQAFYQDASAETKMDLAPLMERMQTRLRGGQ